MRKIIQIVFKSETSSSYERDSEYQCIDTVTFMYALCDDETIWRYHENSDTWIAEEFPPIPQDEETLDE